MRAIKSKKTKIVVRTTFIIVIIALFFLLSCKDKHNAYNAFTSNDTLLVLKTIKYKGFGLLGPNGVSDLIFAKVNEDISSFFHVPITIDSAEVAIVLLDFNVPVKAYKNGRIDSVDYFEWLAKGFRDTAILNILSDSKCYLTVIKGKINDSTILIVDQNNNLDFSDDTLRKFKPFIRNSTESLISFNHEINNDSVFVPAVSWINIGIYSNGDLLYCIPQHISSSFFIDDNSYAIEVTPALSCAYNEYIKFALAKENGIKKDTFLTKDILKPGDYLKLGNRYYKFESITNDGSFITLRKEDNFKSLTGTQIGMIASDFTFCSTDGDTISLIDYKGKYLLFINVSACYSKNSSYKCYKDLTETYKDKLRFIGVDNSPVILRNNIKDLQLTGNFVIAEDNQIIQKTYRPDYCSRTCFLISPEGRIIDKFEIFDWESVLSKHFK